MRLTISKIVINNQHFIVLDGESVSLWLVDLKSNFMESLILAQSERWRRA